MAGLAVVNNAVRSVQTVEEYIKVGMDICNEVALDFLENKPATFILSSANAFNLGQSEILSFGKELIYNTDSSDDDVAEYKRIMLTFAKMEREIRQVQDAVEFVKQHDDNEKSLEEMFDSRLQEVRREDNDETLLQHEKVQDFDKRMWEQLHPEQVYTAQDLGLVAPAASVDEDVEMTQEQVNTKCPYTGVEMVNPVRNKLCGHNYEKDAITDYIQKKKKKAKCPISGCPNEKPVEIKHLEENTDLKRYIDRMNREAKKKQKK